MASSLHRAALVLYERILRYALKFGVVGLLGYAIDVGVFNLLSVGALGEDHFFQSPLGAKIVSVTISTVVTWVGNRYWTFREHRRENFILEFVEFSVIALVGMGISLFCLYLSHYVFGFTSLLADNISANVIGLVIATSFRFLLYRFWVYAPTRSDGLTARTLRAELESEDVSESNAVAASAVPAGK
ncbi:GtrA family protein [Cryobacterium sp. 10I1]|uniref:GtrA family protein n=1 Tax=unclassified Cryobacterium TaxID=2649013 RepID=UPI002B226428|nr:MULTISPECIES: GtrA family protein [unclassified Cryobacterium]MEB0001346.1 GtrA family protein [Cryobacterium sp. RTC2.1]MEB0303941.1 GtrA family protein [Cryobacterium sp. 10I1]